MSTAEGCICGHGQYNHGSGYTFIGRILGQHSRCIRCGCMEFRRGVIDEEFGISVDPCEHPSRNGGICAVCGDDDPEHNGSSVQGDSK